MSYTLLCEIPLSFTISDNPNTQTLVNANTLLFQNNQIKLHPTVSATDKVTALPDDVTMQ